MIFGGVQNFAENNQKDHIPSALAPFTGVRSE